jgi:hypothetical protein
MTTFFPSLTRISDLATRPYDVSPVARQDWREGDYVVCDVTFAQGPLARVELATGRMAELVEGDVVVGALGVRHATLEAVGSWEAVGEDGRMNMLTGAGLLADWSIPVVLIVGTSMSAGKTASARVVVRQLVKAGLKVAGAKLTGAGRYRDILTMRDAGADPIFDFADVGLPSSIGPVDRYRRDLRRLLALLAAARPDVVVAEAGASPLEPYNGEVVLAELGDRVACTVLCASDPYAVVGVSEAFQRKPDLVAGIAATTSASVELVEKLTGVRTLNLLDPGSHPALEEVLRRTGVLPG